MLRYPVASIDSRNPRWETPEYTLVLACQYTQEMTDGAWSLMRHDVPRCGAAEEIGKVRVDADESVPVPAAGPDELLVARFTPDGEGILTRLFVAVSKDPSGLFATADGQQFRLPEALAGGPLLVGYPDRGDAGLFPAFHYGQISFTMPGTLRFSTIPLDAAPD